MTTKHPTVPMALWFTLTLLLALAVACQSESTDTPKDPGTTQPTPSQESTQPTPSHESTAAPTPTVKPATAVRKSTPRATPAVVSTKNPEPAAGRGTTGPTGEPPGPHDQPTTQPTEAPATTALTAEQQDCLPQEIGDGRSIMELLSPNQAGILSQAVACLTDEEITRHLILPEITPGQSLPKEQADCIVQPETGAMIRASMTLSDDHATLDAALFSVVAHLTLTAAACVPPEQFHDLFLPGTTLDRLMCIVPTPEQAGILFAQTLENGDDPLNTTIARAEPCLRKHPPEALIEPYPDCTEEQKESGLPCRLE